MVHPDVATGDETLMRELLDARREIEERRGAELISSTPPVEYASTSPGDMFMCEPSRRSPTRESGRSQLRPVSLWAMFKGLNRRTGCTSCTTAMAG